MKTFELHIKTMMGKNNLNPHGSSPPVYSDVSPVSSPFLITTTTLMQELFNGD